MLRLFVRGPMDKGCLRGLKLVAGCLRAGCERARGKLTCHKFLRSDGHVPHLLRREIPTTRFIKNQDGPIKNDMFL